jgi:hypothetical protein
MKTSVKKPLLRTAEDMAKDLRNDNPERVIG